MQAEVVIYYVNTKAECQLLCTSRVKVLQRAMKRHNTSCGVLPLCITSFMVWFPDLHDNNLTSREQSSEPRQCLDVILNIDFVYDIVTMMSQ